MNIAVIGTGYVGLPTGVGFAELGHHVTCVDKDLSKIKSLQEGQVTLYEDGLEELLLKNIKERKIHFTTTMNDAVKQADVVIIAVGTPPHPETKQADMRFIRAAATELAQHLSDYTVVAVKSTVPVGTGDTVEALIRQASPNAEFDIVSLPEFLREGFAIHDFFNPDRIVIGYNNERALALINEMYAPFLNKTKMLYVSRRSSETIKYASNAFLAMKIHYINEMANFCEKSGADISEVAAGMGLDSRIGNKFLNPGPGYGGSCFPKDTLAMNYVAQSFGVDLSLVQATIAGNDMRKKNIADRIIKNIGLEQKPKITVLGLTFKGGTDDCRESPSIEIISELLKHNIEITAYDPKGTESAKLLLGDRIYYANNIYQGMQDSDAIVILTEWDEFKGIDLEKVKPLMRQHLIMDFRNILDIHSAQKLGFKYLSIGRSFEKYTSDWGSGIHRVAHSQRATEKFI